MKRPWTLGEKALLGVILAAVALGVIGMIWEKRDAALPAVVIPTPAMPAQNAFDYFNAAANAEVQRKAMGYAEMETQPASVGAAATPQLTLAQKAALVQANAPMLRLLRQGLRLPYQSPPIRSYSTTLPYYAPFRETARVIGVAIRVEEAQGQWNAAVGNGLDGIQYGEKMAHGGPLIGLLVGIACEAIARLPLWTAVGHLTPAQAEAAARRLEAIQAERAPFVETVQDEKWEGQAGLLEILRRPNWREALIAATGNGTDSGNPPLPLFTTMFVTRRQIFEDYTRSMDGQLAQAARPYRTVQSTAPPAARDPFLPLLTIDFGPVREKAAYTEAEDDLLMIALALRSYEGDHHAYPTTLQALAPRYLAHVPNDPFAQSQPLRYKPSGGKYLLYSVGPDGKDDGGKPIFDATKPAPRAGERDARYIVYPNSTGDIVAGVNIS